MFAFKKFKAAAALTAAAILLSACGGSAGGVEQAGGKSKMTMAVYPGAFLSLPEYVGVDAGIYDKHGIEAQLLDVPTGPAQISAVASRSVHVAGNSPGNTTLANSQGQDIVYLNNFYDRLYYTWIAQKDLNLPHLGAGFPASFTDLKGMKIGISARGSEVEMLTRVLLKEAGLDPEKDVTWVAVGFGQPGISAFKSKQVDVIVGIEPMNTILLDDLQLGQVLLDTRSGDAGPDLFKGFPGQGRITLKATAEANKELFKNYNEAQAEVLKYMADPANLDAVTKIYAARGGMDPVTAKAILEANSQNFGIKYDCDGHKKVISYLQDVGQLTADQAAKVGSCSNFVWEGSHGSIADNL